MTGQFVVSLDFELHWGTRDARPWQERQDEILAGREAVSSILRVFEARAIHATWATVGILYARSRDEALRFAPTRRAAYLDDRLNPWPELLATRATEADDPFHFAGSLVDAISRTPHQELATHTFSHYYCLEAGQSVEDFAADLAAARAIGARHGEVLRSIVFPRNQFSPAYLETAKEAGVRCFRGNPSAWFWQPRAHGDETGIQRAFRLADAYVPVGQQGIQHVHQDPSGLINVPATRFLRPWTPRGHSHRLQRLRIRTQLTEAAVRGGLFHLWWHPNNFANNIQKNLDQLEMVLDDFSLVQRRYGMRSLSMHEAALEALSHRV